MYTLSQYEKRSTRENCLYPLGLHIYQSILRARHSFKLGQRFIHCLTQPLNNDCHPLFLSIWLMWPPKQSKLVKSYKRTTTNRVNYHGLPTPRCCAVTERLQDRYLLSYVPRNQKPILCQEMKILR